jgi:hypothetical protein
MTPAFGSNKMVDISAYRQLRPHQRLERTACVGIRRGFDMPVGYKPQLDHVGFNWTEDSKRIHQKLCAQKDLILDKSGFTEMFKCLPSSASDVVETEALSFMRQILGTLCLTAAIQMDAGFKPANKIIATLNAVEQDPSIVVTRRVEPEAMGIIAAHYQRNDELPGAFGFDVYQDDTCHELDLLQIKRAAAHAAAELRGKIRSGRPERLALNVLATGLRELFLSHNDVATRHSVAADGKSAQVEAGAFLEFLQLVIAPLNEFFATLPPSYGAKPISAVQIARRGSEISRGR